MFKWFINFVHTNPIEKHAEIWRNATEEDLTMKRIRLLGLACCLCLVAILAIPVFAQSDEPARALSTEDAERIREHVRQIAEQVGVQVPPEESSEINQKTMADVGDRALDLLEQAVASTAATLQKIAPDVYRIMIRQQFAKAITWLILPWGLLAFGLVYMKIARPQLAKWADGTIDTAESNWNAFLGHVLPYAFNLSMGVWGVIAAGYAIRVLINPEYYAIRDLLKMILTPGTPGI